MSAEHYSRPVRRFATAGIAAIALQLSACTTVSDPMLGYTRLETPVVDQSLLSQAALSCVAEGFIPINVNDDVKKIVVATFPDGQEAFIGAVPGVIGNQLAMPVLTEGLPEGQVASIPYDAFIQGKFKENFDGTGNPVKRTTTMVNPDGTKTEVHEEIFKFGERIFPRNPNAAYVEVATQEYRTFVASFWGLLNKRPNTTLSTTYGVTCRNVYP